MKSFAYRNRIPLVTAGVAAAMMVLFFILLGIWPFGGGTVITGDLNSQYISYFAHYKRAFAGEAGLLYGFGKSLGGGLAGLFAYYVSSPFNLIYLLLPVRWFAAGAGFVFFAKTVLACTFFSIYATKKFPRLGWPAVALALGYGFSTFCFVYAQNIMWHDVILLLPLICLGIDRIIAGRRPLLYVVTLALAIFANFYIAFMACIFAVLYFLYGMLTRKGAIARGWKGPLLHFLPASALAGGINAALLLPVLANVSQSKGEVLAYQFQPNLLFNFADLRERLVWGNFSFEDLNGGMPFIYCGILALVLLVGYFAGRGIPLREKLLSGDVLVVLLLSFWVEGLDTLWHALKPPVYFPARYAFLFCFFVLALGASALARRAVGKRQLLIACGLLALLYLLCALFPITTSRARIALSFVAVLLFAALLWLMVRPVRHGRRFAPRRGLAVGLLVALSALELSLGGYFVTDKLEKYPLAAYQAFVDGPGGAVSALAAADDGDYRVADGWFRSLNDPLLLNYRGISHFGSTMDAASVDTLYNLGYRAYNGTGPYMDGAGPFADALLGLKYHITEADAPAGWHWQPATLEVGMPLWENELTMPLLFTVPAGAAQPADGRQEDCFAFQNAVYTAIGGTGELFTPLAAAHLREDNSVAGDNIFAPGDRYTFTAEQAGPAYALFKGHFSDVRILVDGVEVAPSYHTDLRMGPVYLGHFAAGQQVTVTVDAGQPIEMSDALFYTLSEENLRAICRAAQQNAANFTMADGHVQATVTAAPGRTQLFTSIPYDDGWQATVNGQAVQPQRVAGGLLALPLAQGENTVELRYVAPGSGPAGWVVSGICLALFVGWMVLAWRKGREGRADVAKNAK